MTRPNHKYRARKVTLDGHTFDSKGEANRYAELRLMERAGAITDLELQPKFVLLDAFTDNEGKRHRAITYRADFRYIEDGRTIVEDFKGFETAEFKLKRKMFLKRYPDLVFRLTR
jgi:hypothetical protein